MYEWPKVDRILTSVLAPIAPAVMHRAVGDDQAIVDERFPGQVVLSIGGGTSDQVQKSVRVTVNVFALGRTRAWQISNAVEEYLVDRFHYVPSHEEWGLIDTVKVESGAKDLPYASDQVSQVSATYRAVVRPLG